MAENEIIETEFTIDSDKAAEWALKKVLAAKKERERLIALVVVEQEELDRQIEQIDKRYEQETSYLLMKLSEYFKTVEHKETKTQESYQLLSGKLVYKKPSQKVEQDEDVLSYALFEQVAIKFFDFRKQQKYNLDANADVENGIHAI